MTQRPKAAYGNNISLPAAFKKLISDKEKEGRLRTADNYRSTLHKLQSYLGEAFDSLSLNDISDEWVAGFVRWLRKTHPDKPQTAGFYFRNTRTLYNRARKQFKFKQTAGKDPFAGISFAGKQAAKRALTQNEINKLLNPALRGKLADPLRESLDVLLFILFMRGMVFQDVYNLTWDAVAPDNHIRYLRSKTLTPVDTEICREALAIMERYRDENSPYVFPFLHRNKLKRSCALSEQSALHRVNHHASAIGRLAGLSLSLSTYVMRHTWATLMLEAAKPVELISQCLGHTSIHTTQIYLSRISTERVDREVNDMFDRMLRHVEKNHKAKSRSPETSEPGTTSPTERPVIKKEQTVSYEEIKLTSDFTKKKSSFLTKKERFTRKPANIHGFHIAKVGLFSWFTKLFV